MLPTEYYIEKLNKLLNFPKLQQKLNITKEQINNAICSPEPEKFYNTKIPYLNLDNYEEDFFQDPENLFFIDPENRGVVYFDIYNNTKKIISYEIFMNIINALEPVNYDNYELPINIELLSNNEMEIEDQHKYLQYSLVKDDKCNKAIHFNLSTKRIMLEILFPPRRIAFIRIYKHMRFIKEKLNICNNTIHNIKAMINKKIPIEKAIYDSKKTSLDFISIYYITWDDVNREKKIKIYIENNELWCECEDEKIRCRIGAVLDSDIVIANSILDNSKIKPVRAKINYNHEIENNTKMQIDIKKVLDRIYFKSS